MGWSIRFFLANENFSVSKVDKTFGYVRDDDGACALFCITLPPHSLAIDDQRAVTVFNGVSVQRSCAIERKAP